HHVLPGQPAAAAHPLVRRLIPDDAPLLVDDLSGGVWGDARTMLEDGIAAGAVVDGRLVALAHTSGRSTKHADIGVATLEAFRCQGLATAAAALVARAVQATGQTPVWSCGEGNQASLRVAHKLGFVEVSRRTYVIPDAV